MIEDMNQYDTLKAKIEVLLTKPQTQTELIDYFKMVFNVLQLLKSLDQHCLNDFKILLEQSKIKFVKLKLYEFFFNLIFN